MNTLTNNIFDTRHDPSATSWLRSPADVRNLHYLMTQDSMISTYGMETAYRMFANALYFEGVSQRRVSNALDQSSAGLTNVYLEDSMEMNGAPVVGTHDLFDLIAYAGASMFDWYTEWRIDDRLLHLDVTIDCEGERASKHLTAHGLRKALRQAVEVSPYVRSLVEQTPHDPDIDAPASDTIIQVALFGKLVFG